MRKAADDALVRERRRAVATMTAIFSNTSFDAGIMRNAERVLVHLETTKS
jgi:hypothetical protein